MNLACYFQKCKFNQTCSFMSLLLEMHQDFSLLFGPETAAKLLKWHTSFKRKAIREAESLMTTPVLQSLLRSARNQNNDESSEDQPGINLMAKGGPFSKWTKVLFSAMSIAVDFLVLLLCFSKVEACSLPSPVVNTLTIHMYLIQPIFF